MPESVTTSLWLGQRVRLLMAHDTEAVVIGVYVGDGQIKYDCAWFAEGQRQTAYFTDAELVCEAIEEVRIGFSGRVVLPPRPPAPKGSGACPAT